MPGLDARAAARSLDIGGSTLAYWVYEPVSPTAHPLTIVMVHGFRGDHHGLLRIVEHLPDYRIIVPDLPGFGASEPLDAGNHTVHGYATVLGRLFDTLGLGSDTVLLGHSFGSMVAAEFAARNRQSISELILINPICEPALEGSRRMASRLAELYYLAGARLPERLGLLLLRNRLIIRLMSIFMAKTKDPGLRRYIHAQHDAYFSAFSGRDVLLEAFRASITGTVTDTAPALAVPVLLIAAEEDDLGSVAGQQRLAAMVPDAELHVIPAVGHLVHYETPGTAAALITDFLNRRHA